MVLRSYLQGKIVDYLAITRKLTLQLSMNKKTNTIFLTFQEVFNIIEIESFCLLLCDIVTSFCYI